MADVRYSRKLTMALALCARAGLCVAEAESSIVEPAATASAQSDADMPSDEQLHASGATIGQIYIKVVDVFDPEIPKESGALYRAANFLHINTREQTVRPQLLFKPGDVYTLHVLEETARNLRARRYLEELERLAPDIAAIWKMPVSCR